MNSTGMENLHGVVAEYESSDALVSAARAVRLAGYRRVEAYSPFYVEGLSEALEIRPTRLAWLVLAGGIFGMVIGYALQYWVSAVAYPLNVGGRPWVSWPMFVPVTFEVTILCAALAAVLGMLGLNGLPRPHHPLFNCDHFARASRDRFFLCIETADPRFQLSEVKEFLQSTGAASVEEAPLL